MLNKNLDIKNLLLHSSWALTIASGLSYFFGFVRDRIFAQTFGLSRTLDIYNAAFVIPDFILTVLIGTALSAAFLPIFSKKYDEKKEQGFVYGQQMMSWGIVIMAVVGIITAITLPLFAHKMVPGFNESDLQKYILLTRIMLFSPLLFVVSNVYGKMILSFKEFLWYGLSPALYNVGIIVGVLFLVPQIGITGLVIGNLFGILLHLAIRLIIIKRKKYNFKHKFDLRISPEIKETMKLMAPKIFQYAMWSFMLASFTSIASNLAEGSIATYNYARNFQSLPVSMLGIAIATSMYTSLSHDAGKGNLKNFKKDFKRDRIRALIYTTLAAIALAIFSKPLITLLLGGGKFSQENINLLTMTLQIYCIAIPLESMLHIYHRGFYSLKNTIIPATIHTFTILGTIITAKFLASTIGIYALPVSFAVWLMFHVITLATIFPILLKRREVSRQ